MLNLYRRHFGPPRCPAGHKRDSQTYEGDELRPKSKKCGCPIYASGKLGDNPKFRRNTKRVHWAEARSVAENWERYGVDAPPEPPPVSPLSPTGKPRRTIAEAVDRTLAETQANESSVATIRRYRCVLKKLQTFSTDRKGYLYVDEWTADDIKEFRLLWEGSLRYHAKNFGIVRNFFEEHKNFIAGNPVEKTKRARNRKQLEAAQPKPKSPYTDDELTRMVTACARYPHTPNTPQKFFGEDIADFILISAYTGLRISDMATFHISRMTGEGKVHFRAIKNGKWVDTWVPEWLEDIIRRREKKWGPYIFGARSTEDPCVLGNTWRKRLDKLWDLCPPFEEKPSHHRFRHTLVRILLQNGTSVADIAALLGDTEEVVRQSYSKWVPERQERLTNVLRAAFARIKTPLIQVK